MILKKYMPVFYISGMASINAIIQTYNMSLDTSTKAFITVKLVSKKD